MDNMIIMAYDGDNAGRMVGQAILANDTQALSEASQRITQGHEVVKQWVEAHGGSVISGGGDEGTFQIPQEAAANIESLRKDYEFATRLTMTVGVGSNLSEAGKSLMVGKVRGKNQVVQYEPSIEQEFAQIGETGDDEGKKISEAYMQKEQSSDHCKYCAEAESETHGDDCQYCQEHDAAKSGEHDCKYCQEADAKASGEHDHTDDCQYCAEAEANAQEGGVTHEHSGDDCQYCKEADATQGVSNEESKEVPQSQESSGEAIGQAIPEGQAPSESNPESPQETVQEIAQQIETDDPETQTERGVMDNIDSGEAAIGGEMKDNVSQVDTAQSSPNGDIAPEAEPYLGEVLKEGLDRGANDINRQKVVDIVSQALQGLKANKQILEQTKQQAPELYQHTITMIKAMIEMAKMLGLGGAVAQSAGAPEAQPAEVDHKDPAQNEWHDPFPQHPDHGAAASEDAALAPKAVG